MKKIGIICEFNPLHNGHVHFINEIKNKYKDSIIILVLNGYFLQRGEPSILSKEDKVKLSLEYNIDIVLEHPVLFSTQSADTFAQSALKLLNSVAIDTLIFGSESQNTEVLTKIANKQLYDEEYNSVVKEYLKTGINYPTALAKAMNNDFIYNPNDLLGISYIKAIIQNNYNIKYETIKRTNSFHDNELDNNIVSASNIRKRYKEKEQIDKYLPSNYTNLIQNIDYNLLFDILKVKILTQEDLSIYLDVTEGIENKLKKEILHTKSYEEFIFKIKNKRLTYNKINRMLIHILLGITKDMAKIDITYTKVLGFNKIGQNYLKSIKEEVDTTAHKESIVYKLEARAAIIYDILTNNNTYNFENSNKPVIKDEL